jgi:hypothetical protein
MPTRFKVSTVSRSDADAAVEADHGAVLSLQLPPGEQELFCITKKLKRNISLNNVSLTP